MKIFEECSVKQVFSKNGRVCAVESTKGAIECDYFVNCGGYWARKIGHLSRPRVKLPVHPVEHYYLLTNPISDLDPNIPGTNTFVDIRYTNSPFVSNFNEHSSDSRSRWSCISERV